MKKIVLTFGLISGAIMMASTARLTRAAMLDVLREPVDLLVVRKHLLLEL